MLDETPNSQNWTVERNQNYFEPFLGSATVYLGFKRLGLIDSDSQCHLSDINSLLVLTMNTIQKKAECELVIDELYEMERQLGNIGETYYYTLRNEMNDELLTGQYPNNIRSAARMIFINKTCFNGLWRVNRNGAFNVPIGRNSGNGKRRIVQEALLRGFQEYAKDATISCRSWEASFEDAIEGDLIYVDPPYLPLKDNEYVFTDYSKEGFDYQDHVNLASKCIDAASRGVRVIVSNNSSRHLMESLFNKLECYKKGVHVDFYEIDMKRTMKVVIGKERDVIQENVIFLSKGDLNEGSYTLDDIQTNQTKCKSYLSMLPRNQPFNNVIEEAHTICPELRLFCDTNMSRFNGLKAKDKGTIGKMVEFFIFGQLPDTDSRPDLGWADVKTTHFKSVWNSGYAAKERLTITNCGTTKDYSSFSEIISSPKLSDSKYYEKMRCGILFVFEYTEGKYNDLETNLGKRLLASFVYDLDQLNNKDRNQLNQDFYDIQSKIQTRNVTQKGQEFLHIHPHGSKNSKTRALGFKNKFVTILVAHFLGLPLSKKGTSIFVSNDYFAEVT